MVDPKCSRFVPEFESIYNFIRNTSRASALVDVSHGVQQVSRVKRVRYKQNSVVHICDLLTKTTKLFPSLLFILVTFLTMTVGVSVILFSLIVNIESILSSLGTKRPSWVRNDSTDWVKNDLVGYKTTTYSLVKAVLLYAIMHLEWTDFRQYFCTTFMTFCCTRVKEDNEPFHIWFLVLSGLNESEFHRSK